MSETTNWFLVCRRYFVIIVTANFIWEFAHMPLYTLWREGTDNEIVFAGIHCTGGDILIAASTFLAALLFLGNPQWPERGRKRVILATIFLGIGYTVFSEWLNIEVRKSWAYADIMPVLPVIGTGLSPLMQWIVVPALAFWWALRPRSSIRKSKA